MSKRLIIILVIILIANLLFVGVTLSNSFYNSYQADDMKVEVEIHQESSGELDVILKKQDYILSQIANEDLSQIAATVNGEPIYLRFAFVTFLFNEAAGIESTFEDVLTHMILDEVVYQEAKHQGYSLGYEEAKELVKQTKVLLRNDEASYEVYKLLLKAVNFTEDEYWDYCTKMYQKHFAREKFMESIDADQLDATINNIKDLANVIILYEQ